MPSESARVKAVSQAKLLKGKTPDRSSQVAVPMRKLPNETSKTKVLVRNAQNESFQAKDARSKITGEMTASEKISAKDTKHCYSYERGPRQGAVILTKVYHSNQ